MSKRFQIPVSSSDQNLFQTAARQAGLSAAEWARQLLKREAEMVLKGKSWEQVFANLRNCPNVDSWEAPARKPVRRAIKKKDDWA